MDFPQFRDIHHLIPQALDMGLSYGIKYDFRQIEDPDKWEIFVKYRKIVSQFLIDQTVLWSKGEESYVSLAKYLLSFLSQ